MNIVTLVRDIKQANGNASLGRLFLNGKFLCDTLEDEYRDVKVYAETRIPAGSFQVKLINSPKFTPRYGHEMLWVTNVPKFEGILIHPGNTDKNTAGCILLGKRDEKTVTITNSMEIYKATYGKLAPLVKDGLWLTTIDYDRIGK